MQAVAFGLLCGAIGAGVAGELVGEGDEAEALGYWNQERTRSIQAQRQAALLSNKLRGELKSKVQAQAVQLSNQRETVMGLELELQRLHKIQRWTVQNNAAPAAPAQPDIAADSADYRQAIHGQFIRVYRARLFAAVRRSTTELHGAIAAELNKTRDRNDDALQKIQRDLSNKLRGDWLRWIRSLDWLPHESMRSVFMDCVDVGEQIAGELSAFKVRFRNSLNVGERRELMQLREQHRSTVKAQLTETLAAVSNLDGQRQELEATWTAVATDAEQQIANLIGEVERLRLELAQEQRRTKAPILWEPAIGPYQQCGNAIITALAREGIALHRGYIRPQGHKATIALHNVSSTALDALNGHSEALQNLTTALSPIQFRRGDTGLIECSVQLQPKPSTDTPPRYCKGEGEFIKLVKLLSSKPMAYLMGATGSGKSSLARKILDTIAAAQPTVIRLHDPQHGSAEDRWALLKASTSATGAAESLMTLAKRLEQSKFLEHPTVHLFDEIDGILALESEGAAAKKALLKACKEIRHAGNETGIIMGQSSTVGRKGLQWDDVDNFSAIYIGGAAIHAIQKSPRLDARKSELKAQYAEVEDYCQGRNEAEGIDPKAPYAYRFCLLSVDGRKPEWYLIPPFDSGYTHRSNLLDSGVQRPGQALEQSKTVQAETVTLSDFPLLEEKREPISAIGVLEKLDSAPICPDCQAASNRRKGKTGNRWHCDNQGCDRKSFTAKP
ncbi:MAG: AAA family ATPase [Synechococcales cyanobacterium RM1_1_8]|nr:AAA family ATPase [Synechococcales cyanobacterium RM1_1_8]